LDVETAPNSEAAQQQTPVRRNGPPALGWTVLLFLVVWFFFYAVFRAFPYLKNGSDVVFLSKLHWEESERIFPDDRAIPRILIFGNSKILAGFLPARFDELWRAQTGSTASSFNSGFPGSDLFLPPLQAMCARGQAPNILLLTLPWSADPPRLGPFHFIADDHAVIDHLFPFRYLLRDLTAFLLNARSHGGVESYYREAETNEKELVAARGYHLITEQSRFPGGHLPDDFHLASDQPSTVLPRVAPARSTQIAQLNELLKQHHIECYYVPFYLREGEAAPAAASNTRFAALLGQTTSCKLLGPDYYLYSNRLFADQTHLNETGARVYTEALFQLLKESRRALQ
jgi:hypothetical protein